MTSELSIGIHWKRVSYVVGSGWDLLNDDGQEPREVKYKISDFCEVTKVRISVSESSFDR